MPSFYPVHPATHLEPEPSKTASASACLPVPIRKRTFRSFRLRLEFPAGECPGTETPTLPQPADINHRSGDTCAACPPIQPKLSRRQRYRSENLYRQEKPPTQRLTFDPSGPPETAPTTRRQLRPSLDASLAAHFSASIRRYGCRSQATRLARAPEAVCIPEAVTRLAAPNDLAQTILPRKGTPKSRTVYRLNLSILRTNHPKTAVTIPTDDPSP